METSQKRCKIMTVSKYFHYFHATFVIMLLTSLPAYSINEAGKARSITATIDTTLITGEIECSQDVNNYGDLTLNIPIKIYTNENDLNPNISINYNHNGSNGFLGNGWSLSGISIISRVNKTLYYDGKTESIKTDTYDAAFTLDGKRLVKMSSTEDQIIFQPDNDYTKVIAKLNGNNITSFTAYYTDGRTAEYTNAGFTDYYITRCTDRLGNKITFTYESHGNLNIIKKISYGKRLQNYIEFEYKENPTCTYAHYTDGISFINNLLLSTIKTYINTKHVRTYTLNYKTIHNNVVVERIECTISGKKLNPLVFNYDNGESKETVSYGYERSFKQAIKNFGENIYLTPKFNQTSPSSLLYYRAKLPYCNNAFNWSSSKTIIKNQYKQNDSIYLYNSVNVKSFQEMMNDRWTLPDLNPGIDDEKLNPNSDYYKIKDIKRIAVGEGFITILPSVATNGTNELIKINNTKSGDFDKLTFTVYGSNFSEKYKSDFYLSTLAGENVVPKKFLTGDFNGDGKTELFVITAKYGALLNKYPYNVRYYLLDLSEKGILNDPNTSNNIVLNTAEQFYEFSVEDNNKFDAESDKLIATDYNGDGKTDLLHINSNGIEAFTYNNGSKKFDLIATSTTINKKDVGSNIFGTGDFNNDGKTDIIISNSKSSVWNILCSRGNGTFDKKEINIEKKQKNATYYFKDLNNDGIADIISGGIDKIKIFLVKNKSNLSDSNSFALDTMTVFADASNASAMLPYSEGKASFLRLNPTNLRTLTLSQDVDTDMLLTSMIKSNGEICEFSYAWKGTEKIEQNDSLMKGYSNRRVCKSIKSYFYKNEEKSLQTLEFDFTDPYTNLKGLGFMGYSKITKYNIFLSNRTDTTGIVGKQMTSIYDPTKMMALVRTEGSNMQTVEYSYTMSTDANKWSAINIQDIVTTNNAEGTKIKETLSHDKYGNKIRHNIDYGNGIKKHTLYKYKYIDDGIRYIVNVPYVSYEQNFRDNKSLISSIEYEYNNEMLPIKKTITRNNTTEQTEEYAYTTEQLLKEHTVTPYGGTEKHTDKYEYNGIGLLTSHTDSYENKTTFTYDELNRLTTSTDFKQHKSEFEYDALGRVIRATTPCANNVSEQALNFTTLSIVRNTSIEWADNKNAIYKITQTETGKPTKITYYNIYGEAVKSQTQDFDGFYITVDREYDRSGRLVSESFPYKNTSYRWKNYTYDAADRLINTKTTKLIDRLGPISPTMADGVINTTEETGQYENYTYEKLKTTIDNCGRITSTIRDVKGNVIQSTDANGGVTQYEYDPDGRVTKITTPGSKSEYTCTEITYDELGRKKQINDMVHGTTSYTYDNNGHIKTITDGKGNTTDFEYDEHGKITKKSNSDISTTYTYNTDNLISEIRNSNGHIKSYKYDEYLNVSEIKSDINDKSFTLKYTYDGNNISEIKYTTPTKSHNEIFKYKNGIKTCVIRDKLRELQHITPTDKSIVVRPPISWLKDTVYILKATNQMGLPIEYYTGQIRHKREYDNEGKVTRITDYYNDKVLQDFTYTYNLRGEMTSRKDSLRGLSESFEYNDNGWLTSSGSGQVGYDEKGNITDNNFAKNISYDSSNPFAVTSAIVENVCDGYENLSIDYNSMNLPSILSTYNGKARKLTIARFNYDENGNKISFTKIKYKNASAPDGKIHDSGIPEITSYRYYFDNSKYEYVNDAISSEEYGLFYSIGNAYTAETVYKDSAASSTKYYILRDNLGSITKIVNTNGDTVEELSYDAWGNMRSPETWELYKADEMPEELFLNRGYTGHEHMCEFGIINMNARLYDPALGRFVSPDPIFNFYDVNGLNPYAYASNNPMTYVDRNGKFPFLALGAAVLGGWIGGSIANKNMNPFKWDWSSPKTYFGTIFGGLSAGACVYMIAGGSVGYSFVAASPFVNFGGTLYKDTSSGSWSVSPIYNTAGGYNYSEHASDDNVYDNLNTIKNIFIHYCEEYHKFKQDITLGMAIDYSSNTVDGINYSIAAIEKSQNEIILKTSHSLKYATKEVLPRLFDVLSIADGIGQDHGFGYNAQKNMVKIIGSTVGAYVGVAAGVAIGGPLGGIVGGAVMSVVFEEISGCIYDAIYINRLGINSERPLPFQYQNDYNNHYSNFWGTY